MKPRVLLLSRDSAFQRYLANRLWQGGWLTAVIIESGASAPHGAHRGIGTAAWSALRTRAGEALRYPLRTMRHVWNKARQQTFYGNEAAHDARILQRGYQSLESSIPVFRVPDINGAEALAAIEQVRPDLVVVFGTRLVRLATMEAFGCPAINLHWGWSPEYRGEGIVSALALEGPDALGVTVHVLGAGVDDGALLRRERPRLDPSDNFYAIGLRLTVLGAELIEQILAQFAADEVLRGEPQDLSRGMNRGSRFMREHPELCGRAWRRLRDHKP